MIVVDSNIIIYLHVSSDGTLQALKVLQRDPSWIAPPLWQSEFRNVLAGYIRRRILKLENAKVIMQSALQTMGGLFYLTPVKLSVDDVVKIYTDAYR